MATLTIGSVRARAALAPLARPLRTASGDIAAAPLVLIDVTTTQGVTGSAYLFGYAPVTLKALVALIGDLAPMLKDRPVAPAERMAEFERGFRLLGRQGLLGMALSGIDMALWDALGRSLDRSVAQLLGGSEAPLRAYDSYGSVDPKADRAALERSLRQGFTGIKIKLGTGDLAADIAVVRGVREAIGADVKLMVDYNQSLDAPEAIRRLRQLAGFDLHWVEEPVPAEDLVGHAEVRRRSGIAVQTGENWWFAPDMAKAIAAGACDFAMPDLMKIGGVTGWLRAMGQAEAVGMPVSSHLFVEASAHVLAVTPNRHWLEYLDVAGRILKQPPEIENGAVRPRGPGLGLEWDEKALARYLV
jgi:mandelate racemase